VSDDVAGFQSTLWKTCGWKCDDGDYLRYLGNLVLIWVGLRVV